MKWIEKNMKILKSVTPKEYSDWLSQNFPSLRIKLDEWFLAWKESPDWVGTTTIISV